MTQGLQGGQTFTGKWQPTAEVTKDTQLIATCVVGWQFPALAAVHLIHCCQGRHFRFVYCKGRSAEILGQFSFARSSDAIRGVLCGLRLVNQRSSVLHVYPPCNPSTYWPYVYGSVLTNSTLCTVVYPFSLIHRYLIIIELLLYWWWDFFVGTAPIVTHCGIAISPLLRMWVLICLAS